MLDHEYRHFLILLDSERYLVTPAGTIQDERHFPSCTTFFSHSWSDVAFDHWPTHKITVLFADIAQRQDGKRVEYLHRHEEIKIVNVYLCVLTCLHFSTGSPWWGSLDFRSVSNSAKFRSSLLSMRIGAPESTPNSHSSGFLDEGAGITHASVGLSFLSL